MPGTNEGEGSRSAARRYNEAAKKSVHKHANADPSPSSDDERREMEEAEAAGKSRAKELDPAVERDFTKPTK